MLACPSLSDDTSFTHAPRKQRLSNGVVDLMRACMQKVFALQINLCATGVCSQPLRVKQWSGSSGGDDMPTESVSFAFGKVDIKYFPQDEKGGQGTAVPASWDLRANKSK